MYTLDILILSCFDSIVNSNKNFLFAFLDLYDINRHFGGETTTSKTKSKKMVFDRIQLRYVGPET